MLAIDLNCNAHWDLFVRYTIPIVPFFCLAAAWLVCAAATRIASSAFGSRARFAGPAIAAVLALTAIAPSAVSVWEFNRLISRPDNRVVVGRWVNEHVPAGSSVLQSGSAYGHAQFDPARRYQLWLWDRRERIFKVNRQPATGQPDWILVQESPLPSETQAVVKEFLATDYALVQRFDVVAVDDADHVYDRQDAFFVPVAGFRGIERPGPNFSVFKRTSAVIQ